MTVSSRGRYALRLMIDIAEHYGDWYIPIKDVAKRQDISVKYLEQIVAQLARAGLLQSGRGALGGYMLVKPPKDYTAGEILRVVERDLVPVACLAPGAGKCGRRDLCQTLPVWKSLHAAINKHLNSVSLQSLCKNIKAADKDPRNKRKRKKKAKAAAE